MRGASAFVAPSVRPGPLAVTLALVSGLAAIADPALAALTLTLVGLAVGAFLIELRPPDGGRIRLDPPRVLALGIVASAVAAYFVVPASLEMVRGIFLALGATPLWWATRPTGAFGSRSAS